MVCFSQARALSFTAIEARTRAQTQCFLAACLRGVTADLRTKILDFRGFDSGTIFILTGGILMSIGEFPERSSQAILAGIILVERLVDILQRGVQWKQGVVICMVLYTILLYNTTPIHCTPNPLHPPLQSIQLGSAVRVPRR